MDQNATWAILCDPHGVWEDQVDAAHDLLDWVIGGGFLPSAWHGERENLVALLECCLSAPAYSLEEER